MTIIEALLGEHGVLYALFDHIERSLPDMTLDQLLAQGRLLEAALASHARLEDEVLFSALEPSLGVSAGPLAVMRLEHATIEDGLSRLLGTADAADARRQLRHVIATARDHFAKEERILFPMAVAALGTEALTTQGRTWAGRRGVAVA